MIIKMSNKVRSIRGKIEESIDLSSGELKQMIFKKTMETDLYSSN